VLTTERDAYEILQVHPSALPEVVEAAFRALALVHHPDRNGADDSTAMAELNWAYSVLHDPERRIEYDRSRNPIPIGSGTRSSLLERMEQHRVANEDTSPDSPAATVIDFGRYAGMSLGELGRTDPAYLEWLRRHSSGIRYRHQIEAVLRSVYTRRAAFSAARAVGDD
jgi:curved DNA-binding protein CbpA